MIKRSARVLFALASLMGAISLQISSLRANHRFLETPAHQSLLLLDSFGDQSVAGVSLVEGGTAIAADDVGNYYQASGPLIAKYDSEGTLVWSQFQTPFTLTVGPQSNHYDRWQDHEENIEDIQLSDGFDEGELAQLHAQKIVLDGSGAVYVSFLDLWHRDRSVIAKFDTATGALVWVARTQVPYETAESNRYVSKVIDLLILPSGEVAVLESLIGSERNVQTRLVIFTSSGTGPTSKQGVVVRREGAIYLDDAGTPFRDSIGVGMTVASDGTLIYGTFEGVSPMTLPIYPDPYPAPEKLVLRALAAPYTGTPVITVHSLPDIENWYDLVAGPSGTIFVLGTDILDNDNSHPVLVGFNPGDLSETTVLLKSYPATLARPDYTYWYTEGFKLLPTGTGENDALYLVSGLPDFRFDPVLSGGLTASPNELFATQLAVTKVDGAGGVIWSKYEPYVYLHDAFLDEGGNIFLIGSHSTFSGCGLFKYSSVGVLQFAHDVDPDSGRRAGGRFPGTLDATGNIVLVFPTTPEVFMSGERATVPILLFTDPEIEKAPHEILYFDPIQPFAYVGGSISLSAATSSGLDPLFRIASGPGTAIVLSDSMLVTGAGALTVEAYHPGNEIYQAAEPVQQTTMINPSGSPTDVQTQLRATLLVKLREAGAVAAVMKKKIKLAKQKGKSSLAKKLKKKLKNALSDEKTLSAELDRLA